MQFAEGHDAGIVDLRAGNTTRLQQLADFFPIAFHFGKQHQPWSFHPGRDLPKRMFERGGRVIDPWMRHDGEKLVQARPRDGPRRPPLRQFRHACESRIQRILSGGASGKVALDLHPLIHWERSAERPMEKLAGGSGQPAARPRARNVKCGRRKDRGGTKSREPRREHWGEQPPGG